MFGGKGNSNWEGLRDSHEVYSRSFSPLGPITKQTILGIEPFLKYFRGSVRVRLGRITTDARLNRLRNRSKYRTIRRMQRFLDPS